MPGICVLSSAVACSLRSACVVSTLEQAIEECCGNSIDAGLIMTAVRPLWSLGATKILLALGADHATCRRFPH